MTDTQMDTVLKKLPHLQRRMLLACVEGSYKPQTPAQWRTLDVLIRKGLLVTTWDNDVMHDLYYQPTEQVRRAVHEYTSR